MPLGTVKLSDNLELDRRAYELRRAGEPLKLSRIPMELLFLLVERRGELVTRDEIVERIWGKDVFLDTDNSINAAIRKLRHVLEDDPEQPRFVQTITGMGYRFIAHIVEVNPPVAEPHVAPPEVAEPAVTDKESPTVESRVGTKVSHYRILQVLGGGGMGVVYKAEDLKLGRRVAIKFLPAEMAAEAKAFERFEREARAASALDHRNICSIYELGEHEGQPFIVMQLLEGQTVREWIETSGSPTASERLLKLLDAAIQIADGLEVAHQHGIVHRDVKPANIFITNRGEVKILDFGIAKFLETQEAAAEPLAVAPESFSPGPAVPNPTLTRTGASMGTPSYLSPEQIRGEKLDARTDLFSFGLVLYEMATGVRAFVGSTAPVIREAVLNQPTGRIRELKPELPAGLEKIVDRALEKDRDRRYQTAGEMRTELERLRGESAPAAIRPSDRRALPTPVLAALVIFILVVASVAIYAIAVRGWLRHGTPNQTSFGEVKPRRSVAVLGFNNLSGKADEKWISTALSEMLNTELAAGQQLRVVPGERIAQMQLDLGLHPSESYRPEMLSRIRKNLGTDVIVLGSYLAVGKESGGKVRIDVQVQDASSGEILGVISQNGTEADLADLASRGGEGVRHQLGLGTISATDVREIRASVSSNPEATRLYAEGLDRLSAFDTPTARNLFEKAIAVDPNYALAHSALAQCWNTLGYDAKTKEEAKKAFDLSTNLSREERLSIEGRYREYMHDFPATIEIYRTLRNFFPDDPEYGVRLAHAQTRGGLGQDALQTIARVRTLPNPQSNDVRIDIEEASTFGTLGDFQHVQLTAAKAAAKAQAQGSRLAEADANQQEGWAWHRLGEPDKAMTHLVAARELASAGGNERLSATALVSIGSVLLEKGDLAGARKAYEEAFGTYRRIGSRGDSARVLNNLGNVCSEQGNLEEARRYYTNSLGAYRDMNDLIGIGSELGNLALVLERSGDLAGATAMNEQSLQPFREVGDKRGESSSLSNLGDVLVERGELQSAKQNYEQAMKLGEEIGFKRLTGYTLTGLAIILHAQDRLSEARTNVERAITLRKQLKDEIYTARSEIDLAGIALDEGRVADAESLIAGVQQVFVREKVTDASCESEALLTRALLAQGKIKEAQVSAEHAFDFSKQSTDRTNGFEAKFAVASVDAASGRIPQALRALETVRTQASHFGYVGYDFEARLRLGEIELRSGKTSAGGMRLEQLSKDAKAKGFLLVAHKADTALAEKRVATNQ
jgi:tetratricopeptide (TPR) repeat protein/DNA-binding winged helix-turn-helix (wHTH) protein/TolB-like protein